MPDWWSWRAYINGVLCYAIGWLVGHRTASHAAHHDHPDDTPPRHTLNNLSD